MEWKVLYTEPALADLEAILLESFPRMGTPVRNHRGVRRLVHTPVWIFYRVQGAQHRVEILHVWHHARFEPPRFRKSLSAWVFGALLDVA